MTHNNAQKHSQENERIKRRYFAFLKDAKQHNESTIDAAAAAIYRYEAFTNFRNFTAFRIDHVREFKADVANARKTVSGTPLSKSTTVSIVMHLKRFFQWLSAQSGYRRVLTFADAEYFNPSERDARVAAATRPRAHPTIEHVVQVLDRMPADTEIDRRNRALVAFTLITGVRDSAIASLRLKHIDLEQQCVFQDARQVKTKFSKTFPTYFFPVSTKATRIVVEWVNELRERKRWDGEAPLFPATQVCLTEQGHYRSDGVRPEHWKSTNSIRKILREAFALAGLPYYNPHSFRRTLVAFGESCCRTPEEFKALSQNLGHEDVLTTFTSYGAVSVKRQAEVLAELKSDQGRKPTLEELLEGLNKRLDWLPPSDNEDE